MTDDKTGLYLDESHQVWDLIALQVEEFINAWEGCNTAPSLSEFIPALPESVTKLLLTELVKIDLEYRWTKQAEEHKSLLIEDYLQEFPVLQQEGLPPDLLYEEFHIRQRVNDEVTPEEYAKRFPEQEAELNQLLGVNPGQQSMSLKGHAPPDHIEAGQTIDDFDLLIQLGKGAFGSVFLARQRSMQRLVALKLTVTKDDEPQTLAQLDHPNIVRVYDERLLPEQNLRLMYMQHIPGGTLGDVMEQVRLVPAQERSGKTLLKAIDTQLDAQGETVPLGSSSRATLQHANWPQTVSWIGVRLANALNHAHQLGVLHRDLKPANILLSAEGEPKLVDFNISFCSGLEGASPGAYFGGSIAYMSPEQLQAFHPKNPLLPDSLDAQSDVYALGILLWELLTGDRPFPDEQLLSGWNATLDAMINRRQSGVSQEMISKYCSSYPSELTDVLLKALAPEKENRYQSASDLANDLQLCLRPDTQKLIKPVQTGWRSLIQCFPLMTLLLMTLLPNGIAGVFNYAYNAEYIIEILQGSKSVFDVTQKYVNVISYPVGVALSLYFILPVARTIRRRLRNNFASSEDTTTVRIRCLRLGHYLALVGIAGWLIAGFVYPASMHFAHVEITGAHYLHFMGSMALCGLIAATYPFFAVTFVSIRYLYPVLIRPLPTSNEDESVLFTLHRATWFYLALAAVLPMLGIMLMVSLGDNHSRLTLGILSAGGLLGFGLAAWLTKEIQKEIAMLIHVLNPSEDSGMLNSANVQMNLK